MDEDVDEADEKGEEESDDVFGDDELDDITFLDDEGIVLELIFDDFKIFPEVFLLIGNCLPRRDKTGSLISPVERILEAFSLDAPDVEMISCA